MTYHKPYLSKIGKIHLKSDGEYLTGLWFEDSSGKKKYKEKFLEKDLTIFEETIHYLEIYFKGEEYFNRKKDVRSSSRWRLLC